ncbi:MAG: hypothetical protein IT437_01905 [Phycisphaerales bacterium]|nr:hypothetical protein [Phycisphaerales bacterium]
MVRSVVVVVVAAAAPAFGQWAAHVESYVPGAGVPAGYEEPSHALGQPSRMTSFGAVSPFNPPFDASDLVSIGAGGSLVLRFDEPITDNPLHEFGVDLIVFGNTGYIDSAWPGGVWGGVLGDGRGLIEVSADGSDWRAVTPLADSPYPTLGYSDLSDPYAPGPGLVPSDFTRPVNPAFEPTLGTTFDEIRAAYSGSGGGTGVDIGESGLASISYVRITNPVASGHVEVDAIAAVSVPGPGGLACLTLAAVFGSRRRGCA